MAEFSRTPRLLKRHTTGDPEAVLGALALQFGFDFDAYRRSMVLSVVHARMLDGRIYSYEAYRARLQSDDMECRALRIGLGIPHSQFFRDPPFWANLGDALAPLLLDRSAGRPLRIWCAGCADGQEPYTLALLLADRAGVDATSHVVVFASDDDSAAVARARSATYSEHELAALPAGLRDRYFVRSDASFKIDQRLRERVVVTRHDLLRDPLYTKLDVILCRNTLLYFTSNVRRRLLHGFHYALHTGGLLALGTSEMITDSDLGFQPASLEQRIYQRVALASGNGRSLHPWLRGGCSPVDVFVR
jgi:two-component system CheB/CheR fusion protein